MKQILIVLFLLLSSVGSATADVLVLVHGYASNAFAWERSGVSHALKQAGWWHRGPVGEAPRLDGNIFYTVQLPANESLSLQTRLTLDFLQQIRQRHPHEELTLAGHSAGGVVARLAVLRGNVANVARLITIAAPHLGTPRAIQGLDYVNDAPFFCPGPGWYAIKSFVGGDDYDYLQYSQRALIDMLPQGSGSLMDWANRQAHPDIEYHAIVRRNGDALVPAISQDMSQLPVLRGRVKVWLTNTSHNLNPVDGQLLVNILR